MAADQLLRHALVSLEVNNDFSEATLVLADESRLYFRHRVGERTARASEPDSLGSPSQARQILETVARFRLNGKHLDILFADGSRWEAPFR